jgi:hypothetical protein
MVGQSRAHVRCIGPEVVTSDYPGNIDKITGDLSREYPLALGHEGRGITIARLDRATGNLTSLEARVVGEVGTSTAFSPDGTKPYFVTGRNGTAGLPCQLDVASGMQSIHSQVGGYGASKPAPDGQVYWTGLAKPFLSRTDRPDERGEGSRFILCGVSLYGGRAASEFSGPAVPPLDSLPRLQGPSSASRASLAGPTPSSRPGSPRLASER